MFLLGNLEMQWQWMEVVDAGNSLCRYSPRWNLRFQPGSIQLILVQQRCADAAIFGTDGNTADTFQFGTM